MLTKFLPDLSSRHSSQQGRNSKVLIKAIEYITKNFNKRLILTEVSLFTNMSAQHFSRTFKAYTGKTFVEFLTLFRLEKAHQLLLTTDLPITQIPELTGFCNGNYLARVYKNI